MKKVLLAACIVALATSISLAKDGARKKGAASSKDSSIGVGFNSQLSSVGLQSVALRYWSTPDLGFEGIFGFQFGDGNRVIDLGGKILSSFKKEQNLNLYGFGLIGIENRSVTTTVFVPGVGNVSSDSSQTDFNLGGGVGVEFYLAGLPNLSFLTEIGAGYNSGPKTFGTFANWITTAGMRYYFR